MCFINLVRTVTPCQNFSVLAGGAARPPEFWLGGQSPPRLLPKRSFVTFDRGGQTGPPRSNDFFFGAADDTRAARTSGRTSSRTPADDRDFCLVQGYLRTETIDKRNIAMWPQEIHRYDNCRIPHLHQHHLQDQNLCHKTFWTSKFFFGRPKHFLDVQKSFLDI